MMRGFLLLVLGLSSLQAARQPKKPRDPPQPPAQSSSQFAAQASNNVTYSITWTPAATLAGLAVADADQMAAVAEVLAEIDVEMLIRHADGTVVHYIFTRERGDQNNHAHIQAHYTISTTTTTNAERRALLNAEKQWLKAIIEQAGAQVRGRLMMKTVKQSDVAYGIGYDQKDKGMAHYMIITRGLSDADLQDALNVYRQKAAGNAYTSKKMNKTPNSETKLLGFTVGNMFTLSVWFIKQHNLGRLSKALSLSMVMAYALSTGRYRLDDALVTGKNGGATLDPVRAQAFFELSTIDPANTSETIPLIDTILYGGPQTVNYANDAACHARGIPTPGVLAREYDLKKAKAFCGGADECQTQEPKERRAGRCLVVDFLSSPQSAMVAREMEMAGLTCNRLFATTQLPDACGYLGASWACRARILGNDFDQMTMDDAEIYNDPDQIWRQNEILELYASQTNAEWLTGDQILRLVSLENPDHDHPDEMPEAEQLGANWFHSPSPLNFWRTLFARTIAKPDGNIHIMVVNTENAYTLTEVTGNHWFLVAWVVEPEPAAAGTLANNV